MYSIDMLQQSENTGIEGRAKEGEELVVIAIIAVLIGLLLPTTY